ncbi:hypothetical protein CROQUDRAFT_40766 [Cronartium quercuum f. sp. fusiforme G11]|uniref:Uncharacterized protein n=1 Tax=Cronartium quercuum f. sp. fusiforme G11 TaxID=708437 RepID=A0A9P6NMJ8_9BASI|nr:hypothetical protein CROQUDRAFT_40766 [Cronartium quercuum f. sp. fusiforme G11]
MNNSTNLFQFSVSAPTLQLKQDLHIAIESFTFAIRTHSKFNFTTQNGSETAHLFQEIVKGALSYHLDQNIGANSTSPSIDRLQSMSNSINETLESVNGVVDQLLSSGTNGALRFIDLRNCLAGLIQQGGLHDGETCVINGMSITGVSDIMTSVLKNYGGGVIPLNILNLTTTALDSSFTSVIPGQKAFYHSINNAIQSVQSSVSGELIQALEDARKCFMESVFAPISYAERLERTEKCNRNPNKSSVFRDLKTLYLSITNQFVGYAIPNLLESVHQIAENYLNANLSQNPEDHYFRKAISSAARSIIASNSGNQVTYAYKIADCLDTVVGTQDPQTAAHKAAAALCLQRPDGPPALIRQIVYGYLQQVYGYLPSSIAAQIEASGLQQLNRSDPDYTQKVNELHQTFLKSRPGPEYVTCYERFVNCLFDARQGGALIEYPNTQVTCILGDACRKTPDGKDNPVVPLA